jgi:hypothetical protein
VEGSVQLMTSAGIPLVETVLVAAGQNVLSLVKGSVLTTTQMPTNTGDQVVFIANATTAPTANSVGGGILYVTAGALWYRGTGGTATQLGAA